jgi:Xaa-Pro aminopeptidase
MNYFAQRRANLARDLKTDSVDAYLITNETNVRYLTGFTGDSSYLLLSAKNGILVSDTRFEQQIREECPGLEAAIRGHNKTTPELAIELIGKMNAKIIGVEGEHTTIAMLEHLQQKAPKVVFQNTTTRTEALRAIKDASEIEQIRAAIAVAEKAFRMFVAMVRPNDTEKEMADALDGFIRRAGGIASSFPAIVAVGERGGLPHAPPTQRRLCDGSKLLVDWGADLGYKSDITRCFRNPFSSDVSRKSKFERTGHKFEKVYSTVLAAHMAAVSELRPGAHVKTVDAAARKVIGDAGYGDFFTHGLGHGLGLEVHEAPRIRGNSEDVLQEGMVVTIEPGIYLGADSGGDWGGIRIEDDYLIAKDGAIRLTTLPHDPNAIG